MASSKWYYGLVGVAFYAIGLALFVGRGELSATHASELRARISSPVDRRVYARKQLDGVERAYANEYLDAGTVDISATIVRGERAFVNTMVDLLDPAFVSDLRLDCADRYAGEIRGVCHSRFEMLIEREDESSGRITYARAFVDEEGAGGIKSDRECKPYVMCLAEIKVGELIRIPDNGERRLALALELQLSWATPDLFDVEYAERLRAIWRKSVEFDGPSPSFEEPADEVSYEFRKRLVPYLGLHIKRLKRATK